MKIVSWEDAGTIRNEIAGYEVEISIDRGINKAREASRVAMQKLYKRRRLMGLNAHGKPLANRSGRLSQTGLSVKALGIRKYQELYRSRKAV